MRKFIHIKNFDALRLLFASMVVLFHIGILSNVADLSWLTFISATFAVQAFFFVSGFLVTMSFINSSSLRSYAAKRLRRIFPAYICVVIGAAVLLSFASTLPIADYFSSSGFWRYIAFNLILSNFSAPTLPGVFENNVEQAINASLWTIKIEVAFYCFVPLMVFAIRKWNYRPVLSTLFFASLAWRLGLEWIGDEFSKEIFNKLAKQLPGQLSFFLAGAYAYYRSAEGKVAPSIIWAAFAVGIYYLAEGWLFLLAAPFCVGVIVYWLALSAPKIWSPATYGDFSYGIYLVHFPLVQVLAAAGWFAKAPYGTLLFSAAAIILMAILSWFFVERPFIQAKKI